MGYVMDKVIAKLVEYFYPIQIDTNTTIYVHSRNKLICFTNLFQIIKKKTW